MSAAQHPGTAGSREGPCSQGDGSAVGLGPDGWQPTTYLQTLYDGGGDWPSIGRVERGLEPGMAQHVLCTRPLLVVLQYNGNGWGG